LIRLETKSFKAILETTLLYTVLETHAIASITAQQITDDTGHTVNTVRIVFDIQIVLEDNVDIQIVLEDNVSHKLVNSAQATGTFYPTCWI
jgi:hypothetical protein